MEIIVDEILLTNVIETEDESIVVSEEPDVVIIEVAEQGPAGPKGDSDTSFPTNSVINSHRAIITDNLGYAKHASSTDVTHAALIIGVSLNSVTDLSNVNVRSLGFMEDNSWNWTPAQPLFVGNIGQLTQTPPAVGFSLIVATAITPTKIFINIKTPIILA